MDKEIKEQVTQKVVEWYAKADVHDIEIIWASSPKESIDIFHELLSDPETSHSFYSFQRINWSEYSRKPSPYAEVNNCIQPPAYSYYHSLVTEYVQTAKAVLEDHGFSHALTVELDSDISRIWWESMRNVVGNVPYPRMGREPETEFIMENISWWWCSPTYSILVPPPVTVHTDPNGRPHHPTGPAIIYDDGYSGWAWHGRGVPQDLIEGEGWTPEQILSEQNTEIRRCAIERIGWENFVLKAGMTLIKESPDPGNPPYTLKLYELDRQFSLFNNRKVNILVCTNGTEERDGTRRQYGIPVPGSIVDPVIAAARLYSVPVRTYRKLQARR